MLHDPRDGKALGYVVAFLYSIVVAILWIPAFALRRIGRYFRKIGAESWPRANGSVTAGNVRVIHGWIVDYALGQLDYTYRVQGEYFAGSIIRQYADEQAAWDFVDAHRDETVVVRYRDDSTGVSVLQASDQGPSWSEEAQTSLITVVWSHWRDELKREDQSPDEDTSDDLGPSDEETDVRIDPRPAPRL